MKAIDTIRRYDMLRDGDTVLVGVSGGADSMALLHILCALRARHGLQVCAAHVNHGLRGAEAQRDENFVRQCCAEWQVELFVLKADVAQEARKAGLSTEEAGRRVRYAFFREKADALHAKTATAHTLSDSIETMLFNLARGTGLKGLCGIPPCRGNIIRPLIETTRHEVEEYCAKNAIRYMNDSTNFLREYTRNKIRLDMVPKFYAMNPAFDSAALRAMRSLAQDEMLLDGLASEQLVRARAGKDVYEVKMLLACPAELLNRVLAKAAEAGTGQAQEARHIEGMRGMLHGENGGVALKGGFSAHIRGGRFFFDQKGGMSDNGFTVPFCEGTHDFGRFTMRIERISTDLFKNLKNINKSYFKYGVDCDTIKGITVIRSKKPGEGFHPAGRGVYKTFKKLFNEARVPPQDRERLPVIADDEGVVWVYGFGPDERCRVTDQTKQVYFIKTKDMGGHWFA